MKPQFGKLIIWGISLYLMFELKDVGQMGFEKVARGWTNRNGLLLNLSALTIFTLYALGTYSIFLFLRKHHWSIKSVLIILMVSLLIGLRYMNEEIFYLWAFGFDNYYDTVTIGDYFLFNLYYAIVFSSLGGIFYLLQLNRYKENQEKLLQLENKKIELAFLRSQMNPHFLFNTLNNIYTLVYQKSDQAITAFNHLNSLLRYSLYEAEEKVPIPKELKYIDSFITLQELRYNYEIALEMKIDIKLEAYRIPPFLLIAFVENGFKHGDLKDSENPFVIELHQSETHLVFYTKNKKNSDLKDGQGGIGLENVRKRLTLIYQDRHELDIKDEPDSFSVRLEIPLELC